ncbi:MAG TPA: efflux transporter outer membrane subunit [Caulobacteraceae bacterium]|jgi:NodT family efflux transporter outer membrane factor (OMF) lipoprotein
MRRLLNRAARAPVIAAALLAVAGCAVGPNFKPPATPTQTHYLPPSEQAPSAPSGQATPPAQTVELGAQVTADWWTLFQSAPMDSLVRQAIAGSPTLDSARARLAEANETVRVARSALSPQVGFTASEGEEKYSASAFGLAPNVFPLPSHFNLFQLGPNASYHIDAFGGVHRQIEAKAALADYQHDQLDAAYLTLTGETVSEALQVAAARAQLQAATEIVALDKQNLDLVRRSREAGEAPDSDVVLSQSQLAADETLSPPLEQELDVARHALAVLTGRAPSDWSPPDFDLDALTLPQTLPVSLPSELVHHRPDIMAAESQLHAASAQIGVATARLYPDITLNAGISAASLNAGALFDPSGLVWSVAAGLTQPVFDGGMRRAERRAALDDFKATAADYRQTVLRAFEDVADILRALDHDGSLLAAQQRALASATESVRLQQINYQGGGTGLLSLIDAQRQYQQARLGYARALAARYQDTARLLIAMGGGWWGPTGADATRVATQAGTPPAR